MTEHPDRHRVEVAGPARRDLQSLPGKIASAVIEFITGPLAEAPLRFSKPLRNGLAAYRSARRGDYRTIFRIDDDTQNIVVVGINHRAHSYRPR